jgi:DNA mismatch endonuclease (patch repair protein)
VRWKIAVFIDGDFWHGYNWKECKTKIKRNRGYWIPKIERNIQRGKEIDETLGSMGWHVLRIWEHEVKKEFGAAVVRILRFIEYHAGEPDSFRP